MVNLDRGIIIPYMVSYKQFLDSQIHRDNARPLSNEQEDYKREIAKKAAVILGSDN